MKGIRDNACSASTDKIIDDIINKYYNFKTFLIIVTAQHQKVKDTVTESCLSVTTPFGIFVDYLFIPVIQILHNIFSDIFNQNTYVLQENATDIAYK